MGDERTPLVQSEQNLYQSNYDRISENELVNLTGSFRIVEINEQLFDYFFSFSNKNFFLIIDFFSA